MAKINIEEIIKHLDVEFRKALDSTVREHFSNKNLIRELSLKPLQKRSLINVTLGKRFRINLLDQNKKQA